MRLREQNMSKNFELLQEERREEIEQQLSPSIPATASSFPSLERGDDVRRQTLSFDQAAREECLKLVQRVFLGNPAVLRQVIVFVGIDRGNGCSQLCAETARALAANTSGSVCVVDADFRNPALTSIFRVSRHRGLAETLVEDGGVRQFAQQLKSSNLWLLSAGGVTSSALSMLNSDRLRVRMHELRKEFTYILIDTPALNLYADAVPLGRIADGVIVVLEADATRRESALKGLESLREANIDVLGAVLNRRTFPIPDFIYRRL